MYINLFKIYNNTEVVIPNLHVRKLCQREIN